MEEKINYFSEKTGNFYQLYKKDETRSATIKINGVPMHRFSSMDPLEDTKLKISSARPKGLVLDSCMGLGYTAIFAARLKQVSKVITIEKDPEILKMAKLNKDSSKLFSDPKIEIKSGDVSILIKDFPSVYFDSITHDPPTFTMAENLYTINFYKELYRVLKKNGRLWHYAPKPGKLKGTADKFIFDIINKLKKAGFKKVFEDKLSSGIIALK